MALILIVDDSLDSLVSLSDLIQTNGHQCRISASWKAALDQLFIESFDIIICEYVMEEGNALWFWDHLKSLQISSQFHIMSEDAQLKDKVFLTNPLISFCLKPVQWDDLSRTLNQQI